MRMAVREWTPARIIRRHSGATFRARSFIPEPRARSPGLFCCAISWHGAIRAGQMIPVASRLSLTSNCRRSLHKGRPCPLDLAQEKASSFRSDFGGMLLLNRLFQTASLHALDLPYKSPAVFGILSTEVIHYSYSPPFIDEFACHLTWEGGPEDRIAGEVLSRRATRGLDRFKISSCELMQASTCMYLGRLQVKTCNVQRERLAFADRQVRHNLAGC
jgi:hypothetical protein